MEKKVVYEVRLSKPVMAVATIAAVGLFAIGVKPLIEATPAFAQDKIVRVAICDIRDALDCAEVVNGDLGVYDHLTFKTTDTLQKILKNR